MPHRVVRFGPPGWLTVVASLNEDAEIELHPTGRVLAITDLRELPAPQRASESG